MYIKEAIITGKAGLYARPATFFIQKANEFSCSIWIEKDERRVNAKSLLGVLSLGVGKDEPVRIIGDGADETDAVDTLLGLINSNFAE
ncbi:MAG: HPr family phosphocarrier protein [Oscillospiraceae bacterium]|jgi:phosphocarrier protein|nr:HPr family phosphocarrier protein [Oscillospiraceae bacterium]